jgi:hypothetical protein
MIYLQTSEYLAKREQLLKQLTYVMKFSIEPIQKEEKLL